MRGKQAFHASLLRPHVPNDDRWFPGRLPAQIPGFGEKPEEWIVDRIIMHHGKGMGSKFQILWKADDKTWASYREVAHLNALDQYCELMGVKDTLQLPSNYTGKGSESENKEGEEITIQAQVCRITGIDKIEDNLKGSLILSSLSSPRIYPTSNSMLQSTLSIADIRDCLVYEHSLNATRLGVANPPMKPPPNRWADFMREQEFLAARNLIHQVDHQFHSRASSYQLSFDNVSMPADTLETIIHAISHASQPLPTPIPSSRPPVINCNAPHRSTPPPPPPYQQSQQRRIWWSRQRKTSHWQEGQAKWTCR